MDPQPSTFSIVACDPDKDAVGVAVQSKFPSVGAVVPFAAADAGAIATQSFANVAYGPDGLDLLRDGISPEVVVEELLDGDSDAPRRQVGVVDRHGSVAAYTGEDCVPIAGDNQGDGYSVQGNILENEATLEAMADAFEGTDGGLPERFLAALHAGNEAGGDNRGEQSAAMYIARPGGGYDGRNDRWVDVRVDDHDSPIDELERVFKLYDITLLERESVTDPARLQGDAAEEVLATLADLGYYDGRPKSTLDSDGRSAVEAWRGVQNFENHEVTVLEDALATGWEAATGTGNERLVDAVWHGLAQRDRK